MVENCVVKVGSSASIFKCWRTSKFLFLLAALGLYCNISSFAAGSELFLVSGNIVTHLSDYFLGILDGLLVFVLGDGNRGCFGMI